MFEYKDFLAEVIVGFLTEVSVGSLVTKVILFKRSYFTLLLTDDRFCYELSFSGLFIIVLLLLLIVA